MGSGPMIGVLESRMLFHGMGFDGFGDFGFGDHGHGPHIPPLPANAGPITSAAYAKVQADLTQVGIDHNFRNQTDTRDLSGGGLGVAALAAPTATVSADQTAVQTAETNAHTTLEADESAINTVYQSYAPMLLRIGRRFAPTI